MIVSGSILLAIGSPCLAQCKYEVTIVKAPGCGFPFDDPSAMLIGNMNQAGWFAASYDKCNSRGITPSFAFVWNEDAGISILDVPEDCPSAKANDTNNTGVTVGYVEKIGGPFSSLAAIWSSSGLTLLEPADGGHFCDARGVNDAGAVVGYRQIGPKGPNTPYLWQDGSFTYIDPGPFNIGYAEDISNSGYVVGRFGNPIPGSRGFSWRNGRTTILEPLPDAVYSQALAVNDAGCAVGSSAFIPRGLSSATSHATVWVDFEAVELPTLEGYKQSFAKGINNRQCVVGRSQKPIDPTNLPGATAVLWTTGNVYRLDFLLAETVTVNVYFQNALDINDAGQILCAANWEIDGDVESGAVVLTPVDPPAEDMTGDCRVDVSDLIPILQSWGSADPFADLNDDGAVNGEDLGLLLAGWTIE